MKTLLVQRTDLTASDRDAMYALLCAHFDGVTHAQFSEDLAEKNWALLLHNEDRHLVGFSTLHAYQTTYRNDPVSVIFSGDTIVDPSAWGSSALPRAWIAAVNHIRTSYPNGPYYWLLITSGFRTYRFLPVFWRTFYPHRDAPTPIMHQSLLNHLATERFGPRFDPATNVVRLPSPQRLRPHLQGIPPERMTDAHVAFFAQANPHHADGDELVCLTELSAANLTRAGARMMAAPPNLVPCP